MKKISILAVLIAGTILSANAQFSQLEKDFSQFMLLLGREVLPEIQQNDLAGTGIGEASLDDSHFYVALTGGAVVSGGILKFVDEENTHFTALDLYGLIDDNIDESGTARDLYDQSKDMFPYPTVKAAFGLRVYDLDFIFSGVMIPGSVASSYSDELEASLTNFGIRVRKPIIKESGWFPTISLGAGYVYSGVHIKYTLDEFTQDYSGQDLTINGKIQLDTSVHSVGMDLGFSKTFLFITPFLRTSIWHQSASFESEGKFSAQIEGANEASKLEPSADVSINDVAVIFSGGLDINLFLIRLCATGTYNLNTESYGVEISTRIQF